VKRGGASGRAPVRRLAFIAVQVLAVVLLAEVAVRLAAPRHRGLRMMLNASTDATDFDDTRTLPELMNRTMLGFSPGSVQYGFRLNSRSFRTREYDPGPAPDRYRVAALGDSFTFASGGLPHAQHWPTLTEGRLAARMGRPVEVLRFGVPDTGPKFQLRLWQIEVAALEPDAVVVGFFVGNDFVDNRQVDSALSPPEGGLAGGLASVSALVRVVRNTIRVRRAAPNARGVGGGLGAGVAKPGEPVPGYAEAFEPDRPTFGHRDFVAIEARRMALCLRSQEPEFNRLAHMATAVLLDLAAEVEATGARFIVMIIPDQYQVDDELVDEILRSEGRSLEDYDLDRPQRELSAVLGAAGVQVLDLLPELRCAARIGAVYRPRDTHWNDRGNRVAADALAERLIAGEGFAPYVLFTDGLETGSAAAWSAVGGSD
jgi:hypothetical protein